MQTSYKNLLSDTGAFHNMRKQSCFCSSGLYRAYVLCEYLQKETVTPILGYITAIHLSSSGHLDLTRYLQSTDHEYRTSSVLVQGRKVAGPLQREGCVFTLLPLTAESGQLCPVVSYHTSGKAAILEHSAEQHRPR